MKKIYLLLILGIAATTHDSFAMMQMMRKMFKSYTTKPTFDNSNILVTQKSKEKLQKIEQDYQTTCHLIQNKSKELDNYKKPSDLIKDLSKDLSRDNSTEPMFHNLVFSYNDIKFLDKHFDTISKNYGTDYAWNNIICLMHTELENTRKDFQNAELIHSAALVSLNQEQRPLHKSLYYLNFDNYDNPVPVNIECWQQKDKDTIIKNIEKYKKTLSPSKE